MSFMNGHAPAATTTTPRRVKWLERSSEPRAGGVAPGAKDPELHLSCGELGPPLQDLHRAGVGVLAGSDIDGGLPLHEELALFVDAGLSPLDALRMATLNPARYLGEGPARRFSFSPGRP